MEGLRRFKKYSSESKTVKNSPVAINRIESLVRFIKSTDLNTKSSYSLQIKLNEAWATMTRLIEQWKPRVLS